MSCSVFVRLDEGRRVEGCLGVCLGVCLGLVRPRLLKLNDWGPGCVLEMSSWRLANGVRKLNFDLTQYDKTDRGNKA